MGHGATKQAPMYVIKCWRPTAAHLASDLPPAPQYRVIRQETPTGKAARDRIYFPDKMTPDRGCLPAEETWVGVVDLHGSQLSLCLSACPDLMEKKTILLRQSSMKRQTSRSDNNHTHLGAFLRCYNYPDGRSDIHSISHHRLPG